MTTQQAAELWPIIKAFSEGKTIQCRRDYVINDTWEDLDDPCFDATFKYRIKPEPRVIWVNVYESDPNDFSFVHNSEETAKGQKGVGMGPYKTIKFIEAT